MIEINELTISKFKDYRRSALAITRTKLNRYWIKDNINWYVNRKNVKIFVEGFDDYIIFSKLLKKYNVIFLNGTSTLGLIDSINKWNKNKFVLLLDNDGAGKEAMNEIKKIDYKNTLNSFKLNPFIKNYYKKLINISYIKKIDSSIYLTDIYENIYTTEDFISNILSFDDIFHQLIKEYKKFENKELFIKQVMGLEYLSYDMKDNLELFKAFIRDLTIKTINSIFKDNFDKHDQIEHVINHFLLSEITISKMFVRKKFKKFDINDFVKITFSNSNDMQVYKAMIAKLAISQNYSKANSVQEQFESKLIFDTTYKQNWKDYKKYIIDPFINFHNIFKLK